jgi:hypothetical protein
MKYQRPTAENNYLGATRFTSRDEAELCADCNNRELDGHNFKVWCVQHEPREYVVLATDDDGYLVGAM